MFVSWLVNGDEAAAFALLLAAGASDWADGYLADKLNQRSVLGSYLDPLADKVGARSHARLQHGGTPRAFYGLSYPLRGRNVRCAAVRAIE